MAIDHPSSWLGTFPRRNRSACFRFHRSALTLILAMVISLMPVAAQDIETSITSASDWLLSLRTAEGAYPGFDGSPDPAVTVDAVTALALAGRFDDVPASLAYLEGEALVLAQTGPGSSAKLTLMLIAAGQNPRNFATVDPLSIVEHAASAGMIGFGPFDHALGLLALTAAGSGIPDSALEAAWATQSDEGGWSFDGSTAPGDADSNTTALMIRALVSAGHGEDERVLRAVAWIESLVTPQGVPYQAGGPVDANSTALTLRALMAVNSAVVDPLAASLIAFQNDNGSFSWKLDPRDENVFSTVEAIPALALAAVPVSAPSGGEASPEASPVALRAGA